MKTSEISQYITKLIPVSIQAGEAILEVYHSEDRGIHHKEDDSPLTKADLASNKIICSALQELTPHIPIISEENEDIPYSIRSTWDYCWLVDPLDGTKEFINRNGEFTTNIGLVHQNEVIAGIVYMPVVKKIYYAVKNEGAYKLVDDKPMRITAHNFHMNEEGLRVICSRSHLDDKTKSYIAHLNRPKLIAKGSSLKFLSLADGDADVYPRMAPTMEWDTCAAQIILEEAGGKVVIAESPDQKVRYNKENLRNPFFIATAKEVVI